MNGLYELAGILTQPDGVWAHAWERGGGWLWGPLMLALWLGLIAGVVWLVVRNVRPRERTGVERAREILAERYAAGELSSEEYRERLNQLR